jgi:hypothetical protein
MQLNSKLKRSEISSCAKKSSNLKRWPKLKKVDFSSIFFHCIFAIKFSAYGEVCHAAEMEKVEREIK